MRKTVLLCIGLFFLQGIVISQKTEFSANLNSGFFSFNGDNYPPLAIVTLLPEPSLFPFDSPGKNSGFSYEISLQGQRITRNRFIYGLELAYQSLQSKRKVTGVTPSSLSSMMLIADGSSKITGTFIGISPFAGYRFHYKRIGIDLKVGPEYAPCLSRKQKIYAKFDSDQEASSESSIDNKRSDFRIRGQLTVMYKQFGINAGYSHGLSNYYKDGIYDDPQYHSRFIRLGVNYRIK